MQGAGAWQSHSREKIRHDVFVHPLMESMLLPFLSPFSVHSPEGFP